MSAQHHTLAAFSLTFHVQVAEAAWHTGQWVCSTQRCMTEFRKLPDNSGRWFKVHSGTYLGMPQGTDHL